MAVKYKEYRKPYYMKFLHGNSTSWSPAFIHSFTKNILTEYGHWNYYGDIPHCYPCCGLGRAGEHAACDKGEQAAK